MKKNILIICSILLIIIVMAVTCISINVKKRVIVNQKNQEYEKYLNEDLFGTDVITIMNKALNDNQKNNIATDESGKYIPNNENSLIVELIMITNEEKEETTTYRMETIAKVGITEFINNFNTAKFKITNIEYHKATGKISKIEITQQY